MEDGDKRNKKTFWKQKRDAESNLLNFGNVFQSSWIRHTIQTCFGHNRFFLENGFNFLFHFNTIFFILYLIKYKNR